MPLSKNERLKKIVDDHEADRKWKDKKLDMMFTVFEDRFGVSLEEEFNHIEIRKVEAQRAERARKAVEEASSASKDKVKVDVIPVITPMDTSQYILVGQPIIMSYSEAEK
ncbi:hypothetical protein Hanom_Chr03g00199271 [Helianthus anomalus]